MAGLRVPDAVGWDCSGPPERNGGNGAVCRVGYVSQAGVGRNGCACRGSGRYCRCSREGPECTVLFVAVSLAFGSAHSVRCCSHAAWACAVRVSCPGDDAVDSAGKIREGVPRAVPPSLSVPRLGKAGVTHTPFSFRSSAGMRYSSFSQTRSLPNMGFPIYPLTRSSCGPSNSACTSYTLPSTGLYIVPPVHRSFFAS